MSDRDMTPGEIADVEAYAQAVRRSGEDLRTTKLGSWATPASMYPTRTVGDARVVRTPYERGYYMTYGARGIHFVEFTRRVKVTMLELDGQVTMVDDPAHWWWIQEIAAKLHGRVLVGGLGLGLIIHALAEVARAERLKTAVPRVTEVIIVERNLDVIGLIAPELPTITVPQQIVAADIHDYVERSGERFDSAFIDLWVTHGRDEGRAVFEQEVRPLAIRVAGNCGCQMYTLGFVGAEPLPTVSFRSEETEAEIDRVQGGSPFGGFDV